LVQDDGKGNSISSKIHFAHLAGSEKVYNRIIIYIYKFIDILLTLLSISYIMNFENSQKEV